MKPYIRCGLTSDASAAAGADSSVFASNFTGLPNPLEDGWAWVDPNEKPLELAPAFAGDDVAADANGLEIGVAVKVVTGANGLVGFTGSNGFTGGAVDEADDAAENGFTGAALAEAVEEAANGFTIEDDDAAKGFGIAFG